MKLSGGVTADRTRAKNSSVGQSKVFNKRPSSPDVDEAALDRSLDRAVDRAVDRATSIDGVTSV